jgi:branched-chain amino acid transport system permease protein
VRALVLLAGLAVLILLPLAGDIFLVRFVSRILIYALVALSLDLILGYGGMVSFGHAMFFGIGMYVTGILYTHGIHSAFIAWPTAVLVSAAAAVLIGALSLRTGGFYFIMVTLAFSQMFYYLGVALVPYGGDEGLALADRNTLGGLIDLNDHTNFYYVVLGVVLLALYFGKRLIDSSFGLAIVGIRSNERRMRALGFPTFRYKLACFVIAAAVAGLAGALIANQSKYFSPATMHWFVSGELMIMVILGGMGTRYGAIIGAIVFIVLEDILKSYTEHWMAIFGPFLLVIVLLGANGIYGYLPHGKPLFGRKRAVPEAAE